MKPETLFPASIQFRATKRHAELIRRLAKKRGVKISHVLREAVKEFIEKNSEPKK